MIFFTVDHLYKNFPEALELLFNLLEFKTKTKIDIEVDIEKDRIEILNQ